ncbi:MAG: HupE/UreJ family protein [Pseudomonadota bacterium]|nr:HupE/UreJ family protein [Pseudomonadota bacterium]
MAMIGTERLAADVGGDGAVPASRTCRRSRGLPRIACALALLALSCGSARAHKASDAYLQLQVTPGHLQLRWDIALRDLDVALDLDRDGDGKLSWGEVKAAWPGIERYALQRLTIDGCALHRTGQALERRNDGAYAVLELAADCSLPSAPQIHYALFAEVDPTHRGLLKIERPGEATTLSVLVPAPLTSTGAAASSPASGADRRGSGAVDPTTSRWQLLREGVRHILTGYDHILFLLCLLLPAVVRKTGTNWRPVDKLGGALWPVVGIVSAFTIAHSITLALAALKIVSLSPSFIEPAIALTILLAALDNIRPIFPVRRIAVAFFFGLIHGFGFASALAELNLGRGDFAWALLQFNLGIEAGQLGIVVVATTLLFVIRRWPRYRQVVVVGGSALAMLVAATWLVERLADIKVLPI